jgi:hypothetical protein
MTTFTPDHVAWLIGSRTCSLDEEMAEFSLLLPARHAAEMERLARSRGLTLGQLIRQLVCDYLIDRAGLAPLSK